MKAGAPISLVLVLAVGGSTAFPCAAVPPVGHRAGVLGEQALIVWDPARRMEHFVRRASFDSDAPDFGFLVPTPARPELAEAPDAVFDALQTAIQPEVVRRTGWHIQPTLLLFFPVLMLRTAVPPMTAVPPPPVRVLEQTQVGGYDAAVLQADDAPALARWLEEHGYASRPALQEWLRPYVERHWTITAFKVGRAPGARGTATQAVRMSFSAERPFFPYREPADQREGLPAPRELLVYLVGPGRMEGTIGTDGRWPGELLYAAPASGITGAVASSVPPSAVPPAAWLSAFRDDSSPRPGVDDLFFAPAASGDRVLPPPTVIDERTSLPLPLDVLAVLALGAILWRRRRVRRSRPLP